MKSNSKKVKIIYIMGSGHSGSTILDTILGNHPQIQNCGELKPHYFLRFFQENKPCSCGLKSQECLYLSQVFNEWYSRVNGNKLNDYKYLQDEFENNKTRPKNEKLNSEFNKYLDYTKELLLSISAVSDKPIIVDSSKNPKRALNLSLIPDIELILIHLVRDGRAVTWSNIKKGRSGVSHSKRWLHSNLKSELIYHKVNSKKIRVKYEDFVTNPNIILNQIGELVELDFSNIIDTLMHGGHGVKPKGHILAGNKKVFLSENIKLQPDYKWKKEMPYKNRLSCWLFTWPLMIKYRYI